MCWPWACPPSKETLSPCGERDAPCAGLWCTCSLASSFGTPDCASFHRLLRRESQLVLRGTKPLPAGNHLLGHHRCPLSLPGTVLPSCTLQSELLARGEGVGGVREGRALCVKSSYTSREPWCKPEVLRCTPPPPAPASPHPSRLPPTSPPRSALLVGAAFSLQGSALPSPTGDGAKQENSFVLVASALGTKQSCLPPGTMLPSPPGFQWPPDPQKRARALLISLGSCFFPQLVPLACGPRRGPGRGRLWASSGKGERGKVKEGPSVEHSVLILTRPPPPAPGSRAEAVRPRTHSPGHACKGCMVEGRVCSRFVFSM